jgi:hypothetical protein
LRAIRNPCASHSARHGSMGTAASIVRGVDWAWVAPVSPAVAPLAIAVAGAANVAARSSSNRAVALMMPSPTMRVCTATPYASSAVHCAGLHKAGDAKAQEKCEVSASFAKAVILQTTVQRHSVRAQLLPPITWYFLWLGRGGGFAATCLAATCLGTWRGSGRTRGRTACRCVQPRRDGGRWWHSCPVRAVQSYTDAWPHECAGQGRCAKKKQQVSEPQQSSQTMASPELDGSLRHNLRSIALCWLCIQLFTSQHSISPRAASQPSGQPTS